MDNSNGIKSLWGGKLMAFCFECGAVMHNDDARNHVCSEAEKPVKGNPRVFATKEEVDALRR